LLAGALGSREAGSVHCGGCNWSAGKHAAIYGLALLKMGIMVPEIC